jgi:cytochrome P450
MRTALSELLRRMPDLALAPGQRPEYSTSGVSRSLDRLPLVFTPGERG